MNYLQKKKLAFMSIVNRIKGVLPKMYQQVEYIGGTGTQYIDTGYKPNQDTSVEMIFALNNVSQVSGNNVCLFGSWATSSSIFSARIGDKFMLFYYGADNATIQATITVDTKKHTVSAEKNKIYYDDILEINRTENNFSCGSTLSLLAQHGTTAYSRIASAKIYDCKIYDGDKLVRDFVPCYRKIDNVIGLYDLANDVFYTNVGTGTFSKGENV